MRSDACMCVSTGAPGCTHDHRFVKERIRRDHMLWIQRRRMLHINLSCSLPFPPPRPLSHACMHTCTCSRTHLYTHTHTHADTMQICSQAFARFRGTKQLHNPAPARDHVPPHGASHRRVHTSQRTCMLGGVRACRLQCLCSCWACFSSLLVPLGGVVQSKQCSFTQHSIDLWWRAHDTALQSTTLASSRIFSATPQCVSECTPALIHPD